MSACVRSKIFRKTVLIFLLSIIAFSSFAQIDSWPGEAPPMFRAWDAIRAQDYELSAQLFGQWLNAQPNDRASWYSYACVLALTGKDSLAVVALKAALDAGGFPADWSLQDPDFETIRENEDFLAIVERMKLIELKAADSAGGVKWLEQTRAAPYTLDLPEDYDGEKSLPVIMFLHGGSGLMMEGKRVANRLTKDGYAVISIEAAYRSGDGIGFNHWPNDNVTRSSAIDTIPLFEVTNEMNLIWYRKVLNDATNYANLDLNHVIVSGFSLGSFQTFYAIAQDPETYFAAVVIGARLSTDLHEAGTFTSFTEKGGKLLLLQGETDLIANADTTMAQLTVAGVDVTKSIIPGIGHEVNSEVLDEMATWLEGCLKPEND
jgi:predicted esterase